MFEEANPECASKRSHFFQNNMESKGQFETIRPPRQRKLPPTATKGPKFPLAGSAVSSACAGAHCFFVVLFIMFICLALQRRTVLRTLQVLTIPSMGSKNAPKGSVASGHWKRQAGEPNAQSVSVACQAWRQRGLLFFPQTGCVACGLHLVFLGE